MVSVPAFLLRRLFLKGSLKNSPDGIMFQLKNSLGSGYAKAMLPVSIDNQQYSMDKSYFITDASKISFSSVTQENPFSISMNKIITILIDGAPLTPGSHKVEMGFVVPGLGDLKFDVKDSI